MNPAKRARRLHLMVSVSSVTLEVRYLSAEGEGRLRGVGELKGENQVETNGL